MTVEDKMTRCETQKAAYSDEVSACHEFCNVTENIRSESSWVQKTIADGKDLQQSIRNHLNPRDVPDCTLLRLKDLLSDAKRHKSAVTEVTTRARSYLDQYEDDPLLSFDLDALTRQWKDLRRLVQELGREAQALNGFRSEVCLYYASQEHSTPVSSPIKERFLTGKDRKIQLPRHSSLNRSLLKEKGRKWFAKLSIPYRVFIKSKVKLHYKGRSGASEHVSFTESELSTITECSSLDSSFRSISKLAGVSAELKDAVKKRLPSESGSSLEELTDSCVVDPVVDRSESLDDIPMSSGLSNQAVFSPSNSELVDLSTNNKMASIVTQDGRRASPTGERHSRMGVRASPVNMEEEAPRTHKRRRIDSDESGNDSDSSESAVAFVAALSRSKHNSPRWSPTSLNDINTGDFSRMSPISFSASPPRSGEADDCESFKPEAIRAEFISMSSPLVSIASPANVATPYQATPPKMGVANVVDTTTDLRNLIHGLINNNSNNTSFDSSLNSSTVSTPCESPYNTMTRGDRSSMHAYRKHELWAAIASDYQYLMGHEIIDTCKSTESDLSLDSDDCLGDGSPQVSFNEFLQQYTELTEWLATLQQATRRPPASTRSEQYINQRYQEELLSRSPRRRLFNEYARQLQRRYPRLRDDISARLQRLNGLWAQLEQALCPQMSQSSHEAGMISDLNEDLQALQKWLAGVESRLAAQTLRPDWTPEVIKTKIQEHKVLQSEIESHNRVVSAILQLSERLENTCSNTCSNSSGDNSASGGSEVREALQLEAINLERRWHAIWLQSLELQCRLEEGITRERGLFRVELASDLELSGVSEDDTDVSISQRSTAEPIATQTEFSPSPPSRRRLTDFGTDPIHLGGERDAGTGSELQLIDTSAPEGNNRANATGNSPQVHPIGAVLCEESDTSLYDIIPFSDCEYEKIPVDTDGQISDFDEVDNYEKLGWKSSPDSTTGHYTGSGCDTDQGVDSALCRSYSDQSVEAAPVAKDTVGTESIQPNARTDMSADGASEKSNIAGEHDIGYSSESHSNEELEHRRSPTSGRAGRATTQFGGKTARGEAVPTATSSPRARMKGGQGKTTSWRHSMTSAYDTCSNGSDLNMAGIEGGVSTFPPELNRAKSATPDGEQHDSGCASAHYTSTSDEYSMSRSQSANHSFYYMTTIEGESSSSVDPQSSQSYPHDRCESGNSTDLESVDMPLDEDSYPISTILEESVSNEGEPENLLSSRRRLFADEEMSDSLKRDGAEQLLSDAVKSLSKLTEVQGRAEGSKEDDFPLKTLGLFKQLELFTQESELDKLKHQKWPVYSHLDGEITRGTADRVNDSFTSTDGSAPAWLPRASSCDASDESGSELSSVSGLGVDISPYSISESAIDERGVRESRKDAGVLNLRRTASEQQQRMRTAHGTGSISPPTTRKQRRRRLRHSASEETRASPVKRLSPGLGVTKRPAKPQRRSASPSLPVSYRAPARRANDYINSEADLTAFAGGRVETREPDVNTETGNAAGEMSEHAWDHFQMPPQSAASDDPGEDMLDANQLLQTSWELTSQDEPQPRSFRTTGNGIGKMRASGVLGVSRRGGVLDSDSDADDLQNVLDESLKAFEFTKRALSPRQHPMETGLVLEPAQYNESLATCRTNAQCLDAVAASLPPPNSGDPLTDQHLDTVLDLAARWESLETLAYTRVHQSTRLRSLYEDMTTLQEELDAQGSLLERKGFADLAHAETTMLDIKERANGLSALREKLLDVCCGVQAFENNHDDVNMNKFMREVDNLETYMDEIQMRSESRTVELERLVLSWHDLAEKSGELKQWLEKDAQVLEQLSRRQPTAEPKAQLANLMVVGGELSSLTTCLEMVRALHADVAPWCGREAELELRAQLGGLSTGLTELRKRHLVMSSETEKEASRPRVPTAAIQPQPAAAGGMFGGRTLPTLCLVLVAALVLAYLLDPSLLDHLALVISPELRYVRGPPPT